VAGTLGWFENQCALNSREPMQAFLQGARRHGWQIRPNDLATDAVVIWSVLWAGRMRNNQQVYQQFRDQGRPVFVIDVGSICRNVTWKVALNHVTAQGHYGHQNDIDLTRPEKLGIRLEHQVHNNGGILIAGQHAKSLQMQTWQSQEAWINHAIDSVRQHTDRSITVRPHPRSRINVADIRSGVTIQAPRALANTYDSFDLAHHYHATVNHNSGVGIQSAMAGCRVIVDSTSLAHPVSISPNKLESANDKDRTSWFIEICHTEYLVEEMALGLPFERLTRYIS
jgi:hypothetical protein